MKLQWGSWSYDDDNPETGTHWAIGCSISTVVLWIAAAIVLSHLFAPGCDGSRTVQTAVMVVPKSP